MVFTKKHNNSGAKQSEKVFKKNDNFIASKTEGQDTAETDDPAPTSQDQ